MQRRSQIDRRRGWRGGDERLRSIVERMADGIIIVDLDGHIRFSNPAAQRLFGRDAADLAGVNFGLPAIAGESAEIELVRPGSTPIAVELRVVDTEWDGEPARLASLRDISDRKQAEERAAQLEGERLARAAAEAASRAKSEFLATMSHELRTPLNAIIGFAELLDLGIDGALSDEQRSRVARILAGARHLRVLVNEILDLAKSESGRLSLQRSVARAAKTADEALALVQPLAEAHAVSVAERCTGSADTLYAGDQDRVRQILVNLLENAVKFSPAGGTVSIECGVAARLDADAQSHEYGPWVYLRVADTGPGIPADRIPAIFEPFVQVEGGRTRPVDGSGIGLAISRRLARAMGGDLTVRSEVGRGSEFTLWLPEARADDSTKSNTDASGESAFSPDATSTVASTDLAIIGRLVLRELEPLLDGIILRVKSAPLLPAAQSLSYSQLAGHLATFLADVGEALCAAGDADPRPSMLVGQSSEIQRLIAAFHGEQRARLGWTSRSLGKEWEIVHEEIERVLERPGIRVSAAAVARARVVIERLIRQANEESDRALRRTSGPLLPPDATQRE